MSIELTSNGFHHADAIRDSAAHARREGVMTLQNLSTDVFLYSMLPLCTAFDCLSLASTCKQWRNFLRSDVVWAFFYERDLSRQCFLPGDADQIVAHLLAEVSTLTGHCTFESRRKHLSRYVLPQIPRLFGVTVPCRLFAELPPCQESSLLAHRAQTWVWSWNAAFGRPFEDEVNLINSNPQYSYFPPKSKANARPAPHSATASASAPSVSSEGKYKCSHENEHVISINDSKYATASPHVRPAADACEGPLRPESVTFASLSPYPFGLPALWPGPPSRASRIFRSFCCRTRTNASSSQAPALEDHVEPEMKISASANATSSLLSDAACGQAQTSLTSALGFANDEKHASIDWTTERLRLLFRCVPGP